MGTAVYWSELQSALSTVGLKVVLNLPRPGIPWSGKINGQQFTMTIPPVGEKGIRNFMVVSLYGQKENEVIPLLARFMGYGPFCHYLHRVNNKATATYEWNSNDPVARFKELEADKNVYNLQKLEPGFIPPPTPGMERYYQQFTPEILSGWETAVVKNDQAKWEGNSIKGLLSFMRKVMPRVGQNQSLMGLSIISLEGKLTDEREIVLYGLDPLLKAGILTSGEVEQIVDWYQRISPTWDSGDGESWKKEFDIEGTKYRLITDSYRNCRDLNLLVIS